MRPYPYMILSAICCLFACMAGMAQPTLLEKTTADGELLSISATRDQEPIYHGTEYWWYPFPLTNGIAYFKSDSLTFGDLVYYGRNYSNVPLIYDQVADELITVALSGHVLIRMYNPAVSSFKIHGAQFMYFEDTSSSDKQGFWQRVVEQEIQLFKREVKVVKSRIIDSKIAYVIQPLLFYRIYKNGVYHEVTDRASMLEVFADKKEQINNFLRVNRRKFRKAGFEHLLTKSTTYYNQIYRQ